MTERGLTERALTERALSMPLRPPTRVDDVEDRLVTAIAIGEYLPGARLPAERELAAVLGTGRMTVRSALARLVDRGLIDTQRGRVGGSFVREQWPPSSTDAVRRTLTSRLDGLRDTVDAIARLHGAISRAAAERRTEEDVVVLRQRLDGYRLAASGRAAQHADELLHTAIIDVARNRALKEVLSALETRISIGAPAHLWGGPDGMAEMEQRALGEHEDLIGAITDSRPDDAESIARRHVGIDLELIAAALERTDRAGRER